MPDLNKILRQLFPHGHPDFIPMQLAKMHLHSDKNKDYAGGGNPLGNFQRVSAIKKLYPSMDWASPEGVALGYMLKQLDAALWLLSNGQEGGVENIDTRLGDVSVYIDLARILHKEGTPTLDPDYREVLREEERIKNDPVFKEVLKDYCDQHGRT